MYTDPPTELVDVVSPASKAMLPAVPPNEVPTTMEMEPATPPVADPLEILNQPLVPLALLPDDSTTVPDVPTPEMNPEPIVTAPL